MHRTCTWNRSCGNPQTFTYAYVRKLLLSASGPTTPTPPLGDVMPVVSLKSTPTVQENLRRELRALRSLRSVETSRPLISLEVDNLFLVPAASPVPIEGGVY